MPNKALTIDVNAAAIPNGMLDQWTALGNTTVFIKNILTPKLDKKTNIGQLVSGIPSAFARVDLFKTALDHVATNGPSDDFNNLLGYYTQLSDEWKGIVACLALDYAHISVRKIDLTYSDGNSAASTVNVYEPKGAFGNMLLRRASRWCSQGLNANATPIPYINIIKYRGQVVGATAPESILFTSTGYRCESNSERPWIHVVTGKFTDPLKSTMSDIQLATLHAYVVHIINGLNKISDYFSKLPAGQGVDYTSISTFLNNWKKEIEITAENKGFSLDIASTPPVNAAFFGPFADLLCHTDILYGLEGVISGANRQSSIMFDPKDLLLEDNARIAKLELNVGDVDTKKLPILVLTADIKGMADKAYFALPLSAQGLNVFGKNVAALVGMSGPNTAIKSTLKATYDPEASKDNLEVVLTLVTDAGTRRQFRKVYTSDGQINNKDILIWPNFISPQWDAYFMYNELPHNAVSQSYRAFPFVGEMQEGHFRIIVDKNQSNAPLLLSDNGAINVPPETVDAELLIECTDAVADNMYKYEIYRSNKPFKGVRLLSPTNKEGGYILINYSAAQIEDTLPRDWMTPGAHPALQDVRVGIDFGSTNTSIAYSSDSTQEQGFEFKSQRVSLMGNELPGHPVFPRENQVFFFQGAGVVVPSNAVKSILTIHDNRRLPALKQGESVAMRNSREVVGGFPCFADNLPFAAATSNTITLHYPYGVGDVMQIHNMKWEDTDADKARKSAFLRTLMLQVYATLFEKGYVPTSVKWSYPSAMGGPLLLSYQDIWNRLKTIVPVLDELGSRYKLNISRYETISIGDNIGGELFASSSPNDKAGGTSDCGFSGFGETDLGSNFGNFGNLGEGSSSKAGGFNDAGGFGGFGGSSIGLDAFGQSEPNAASVNREVPDEEFLPDDPNSEVKYEPEYLYDIATPDSNPSMSEAEAVANFISVQYGKKTGVLNLCFDVGGSTTDISALFCLQQGVTMIKQNSIRFAAQKVSQSVSHFPNFRNVLNEICSQFKITMVGLNQGKDTYNSETAPYFFDQIINKLDDDQLRTFYSAIGTRCPQLMCVNMYVTGLLMYYAGQLAHKLIDNLLHTSESEWPAKQRPMVRVTFAGKGSRLFQWLETVYPKPARQYYNQMFMLGYGKKHMADTLAGGGIVLPQLHDANIKYEVSKGLAKGDTLLQRPKKPQTKEIIGETGFEILGNDHVSRPLEFTNSITPAMMESIGTRLRQNTTKKKAEKFTEFCYLFCGAASQLFSWDVNPEVVKSACANLDITAYVQNLEEYRVSEKATRSGSPFSFVAPVIILEGMMFYQDTLLNLLRVK